jgi:hypothetical protein
LRLLHDTNFKYNSIQNQNGQSGNITEAFIKDCLKLDKNNTYYADTLYEFYKNYYKLFYTGALLPKYVLQKKYVNYCQLALIKNPAIHVPITDMPLSELMLTREGYVPVRPFVCIVGAGGLAPSSPASSPTIRRSTSAIIKGCLLLLYMKLDFLALLDSYPSPQRSNGIQLTCAFLYRFIPFASYK